MRVLALPIAAGRRDASGKDGGAMRLLSLPIDKAAARAMKRASATPIEWNCAKGLHCPTFLIRTWACSQCGVSLDVRSRCP